MEERVNRNSQNSNKPPSSDVPFKKPGRNKKKNRKNAAVKKGIQKVIDRVSEAVFPAYEKIGQTARNDKVDETSWFKSGGLHWLWVMATSSVAFYLVHPESTGALRKR